MRDAAPRPIDVVIDGTDGAGKSACVRFLAHRWTRRGLAVATHAPYREQEVYPLWASAPLRAAQLITGIMARFRAAHAHADVIVWDRGWPTAFVTTDAPLARALFEPLPPLTLLLLGSTSRTRAKAQAQALPGIWVRDDALIDRYNAAYHALASASASASSAPLHAFPDAAGVFDFESLALALESSLEPLLGR